MICLDEGILRAYLDGELSEYETLSVNRHLSLCEACQRNFNLIEARTQSLSMLLADLNPLPRELRTDTFAAQCAFTRFKAQYDVDFEYPVFAPVITPELHFLLPQDSLFVRLLQQLRVNWQEFKRHPYLFLAYILRGENPSPVRRRRLQTGTAVAMASYALVFTTLIVAGVIRTSNEPNTQQPEPYRIIKLASPAPIESQPKSPPEFAPNGDKGGFAGGSKTESDPARGGGSGGRENPALPGKGRIPQLSPGPQLLPPDPRSPNIYPPKLIVPETLTGDPALSRNSAGRTGSPDGNETNSSGPGRSAGIGDNQGTGIGSGSGPGYGPGQGGNRGKGEAQLGGGLGKENIRDGDAEVFDATESLKPTILYRERAHYTEEARQHGIRGTVLLSAIFGSDGRIREIQTLQNLPYGLTETSIEAVKKIRFRPAIKNGNPVSVRMQLEFNFNLF